MVLRVIGKTFIAAGVFLLLSVVYQLFGTNLVANLEQKKLAAALETELSPTPVQPTSPGMSPLAPSIEPPDPGKGIARIVIPKIGVSWVVVEGVKIDDLKKGPGHWPGTPLPGQTGNVVVSGHRTTYGAPFFRVNELVPGDTIQLVSASGSFTYSVKESKIVRPTDIADTISTSDSRLTLTTCHPRFSAAQRMIIIAELIPVQQGQQAA